MPRSRAKLLTLAEQGTRNVVIYVSAVIVLAVLTLVGVLSVLILRPMEDNAALIATIVSISAPTMIALIALITRENHLAVNSRLDEMIVAAKQVSRAEGIIEGNGNGKK